MSFAFSFDNEDDLYQFAYCYPYSYSQLQSHLDSLERRNYNFFTRELLCLTVVGCFCVRMLIRCLHIPLSTPSDTQYITFVLNMQYCHWSWHK